MKDLIVLLLVLNALFWGLASHARHCALLPKNIKCPAHWIHMLIGIVSFAAASVYQNMRYVKYLMKK